MARGTCVCQVCTCGRHRCPHNRGSLGKDKPLQGCKISEYVEKYPGHGSVPRREPLRPPHNTVNSTDPMGKDTSYTRTFTKPELVPIKSFRPNRVYKNPSQMMNQTTSYIDDYVPRKGSIAKSFAPPRLYKPNENKCETDTSYNKQFVGVSPEQRALCRGKLARKPNNLNCGTGKIGPDTKYKDDYGGYGPVPRTLPCKPNPALTKHTAKFQPDSNYMAHYKRPDAGLRLKPIVHPGNKIFDSDAPFVGESTFKGEFKVGEFQPPPGSYAPVHEFVPYSTPVEKETTHNRTYKPYDITKTEKPAWTLPREYNPPTRTMANTTNYQEDYKAKPAAGTESLKPPHHMLFLGDDDPETQTHYNKCYGPPNDPTMATSFRPYRAWEPPTQPLDSVTQYAVDFKGEPGDRRAPLKPCLKPVKGAPFSGVTEYCDRYKDRVLPCPAIDLKPKADILETVGETIRVPQGKYTLLSIDNGHRYFDVEPPSNHNIAAEAAA